MNIPQSLPQSPRILIESADAPFFMNPHSSHSSKAFSSHAQVFPTFNYPIQNRYEPQSPMSAASMKLKGYNLGERRRVNYTRSTSMEQPKPFKPFIKRPSWEERRQKQKSQPNERYQINEVIKENSELLRKYSDPKVHDPSSLSLWQNSFKAKLASLFRNKKKYTIMEPRDLHLNERYSNNIHRAHSAQSLPALMKHQGKKSEKKDRKNQKMLLQGKKFLDGKLKTLNLNPPQMIGGSYDNLLLIDKLSKKKRDVYDTYHGGGRPLISQAFRLKALYKYRKPSESDDATTLSFEYDSGEMSDSSSLAQSSSDTEMSSSFSDVTNSNRAYRLRMSSSVHSMPAMKLKRELSKKSNSTYSPIDTPQFSNPPSNSSTFHGHTMPMTMLQGQQLYYPSATFPLSASTHKPLNFLASSSHYIPNNYANAGTAFVTNFNAQSIKNFFTLGPGSSDEFPLVSF
jgi:hypothetical protein